MMTGTWHDFVLELPVLVTDIRPRLPNVAIASIDLRLVSRHVTWNAVAWPSMPLPDDRSALPVCDVTLLDIRQGNTDAPFALVHWEPVEATVLLDLLPDHLCPIPEVVTQTCDLIRSIAFEPLRALIVAVLRMPQVHERYWTLPASLSHHHAYPGGLAQHSLEVTVAAANIRGVDPWQRDILVTYALLHDIGKVWAYANGRLTDEARRAGHEAIGHRRLLCPLASLQQADAHTHGMLDALLSGAWKSAYRHPAAALGDIVRAMDRFSAARDIGNAACR